MIKIQKFVTVSQVFRFKILTKKKWTEIKEKFVELSREVYCECYPKIFEEGSHLVNKLMYTFFFLSFTGLTCYLVTQNVLDYLRQEIFCNLNKIFQV